MRGVVAGTITGFVVVFLLLFIQSTWLFGHLSPRFVVNAIPPEGMEDSYLRGTVDLKCPNLWYELEYSFPTTTPLTRLQMVVEGRATPIDLCRPTPTSPGDAPLCPGVGCSGATCYSGRIRHKHLRLPVCEAIKDSSPLVRIIPYSFSTPLAVGTLIRHATQ